MEDPLLRRLGNFIPHMSGTSVCLASPTWWCYPTGFRLKLLPAWWYQNSNTPYMAADFKRESSKTKSSTRPSWKMQELMWSTLGVTGQLQVIEPSQNQRKGASTKRQGEQCKDNFGEQLWLIKSLKYVRICALYKTKTSYWIPDKH
jgi:hypothetical protein